MTQFVENERFSVISRICSTDVRGDQSKRNYLSMLIDGAFKSVGHPIDFFAHEAKVVTINKTAPSFARFLISVCFISILPFNVY